MTTISMKLLPGVALEEPEMAFGEPWQAEAFATALQLSQNGAFTWGEWVNTFSTVISQQPQRRDESIGDAYYRQWLTALETVLKEKALLDEQDVEARQALWHLAYLNTPHGQPVLLQRVAHIVDPCVALKGVEEAHPHHHHHHHHHGLSPVPIAVDAGIQ